MDGRDMGGAEAGEGYCGRGVAYCRAHCLGGVAVIAAYGWLQYRDSCAMPSIRGAPLSMDG